MTKPDRVVVFAAAVVFAAVSAQAGTAHEGRRFRDCAEYCPEMVELPPGSFTMGSPENEAGRYPAEGPAHRVTIAYAFAVGRYPVTRGEYAQFAAETRLADPASCETLDTSGRWVQTSGAGWRNPGFSQSDRDPVVCASWNDAQAYVAWLSQKTGHRYRLLSEAEYEYAARAGTQTSRYVGTSDAELCKYYNLADLDYIAAHPGDSEVDHECHDGFAYTSPVGHFAPNPFGLYDMLGNALEWTADCWNRSYDGAPVDGSAWLAGDCSERVWRGGCWLDDGKYLRAAYRNGEPVDDRYTHSGFRVARDL